MGISLSVKKKKKTDNKNTENHFEHFTGSFWLCELVPDLQKAVTFLRLHTEEKTNLHSETL